jgi:hypothetical protein
MLSLVALEVANRLLVETRARCWVSATVPARVRAAYALVIVQTPAYIGAVGARLLIELFAVGVIAYWWFFRPEVLAEARH